MNTNKNFDKISPDEEELDNYCENCKKEHTSVSQNFILTGFKWCESCRLSKTIFPIQTALLIGNASILDITKETDKNAIIKKDKNTTPKDLKFDFRLKVCFVATISDAKIQNWVRNITGNANSGVTAKNLIKPGA